MSKSSRRPRAPKVDASRPRLLAAYLRLTVDRNGDKIGYTVQREAIEQYAEAYGYQLVWFQDKDLTAADKKVVRPEYEKMLKRVAAGEFAGIIVWRLDRLVRLTREFERCFGIVDDANAFIIDVFQQLSTHSDIGKIVMRILVMLAEMEISAMRARARAHQNWKAKNGKPGTGGARPFGFIGVEKNAEGAITNRGDAGIKHHPVEAALIVAAAQRIAYEGATYNDIAREWSEATPPVLGTGGGTFSGDRLREVLTAPRVAGYREYDVFDNDGDYEETALAKAVWEPVIDPKVWEILKARAEAGVRGVRTTANEYLFTDGVAKCGECTRALIGTTIAVPKTGGRAAAYRCNASVPARKAGSCGKPIVRADYLEDTVLEQLFARLEARPDLHDAINVKANVGCDVAGKRQAALQEINECDEQLASLGGRTALRKSDPEYLTEPEARGRAAAFRRRWEDAQKELRALATDTGHPTPSNKDRKDIRGWFERLSLGERRSWLAAQVADVFIDPVKRRLPTFDASRVRTLFTNA